MRGQASILSILHLERMRAIGKRSIGIEWKVVCEIIWRGRWRVIEEYSWLIVEDKLQVDPGRVRVLWKDTE